MKERLCLTDFVLLLTTLIIARALSEFGMLIGVVDVVFSVLLLIELAAIPVFLILLIWKYF